MPVNIHLKFSGAPTQKHCYDSSKIMSISIGEQNFILISQKLWPVDEHKKMITYKQFHHVYGISQKRFASLKSLGTPALKILYENLKAVDIVPANFEINQ
jgi:hypothetical protein